MNRDVVARRSTAAFAVAALIFAAVALQFEWPAAIQEAEAAEGKQILSFSTVGDSRQDPVTPDPTTLPSQVRMPPGSRIPKHGRA